MRTWLRYLLTTALTLAALILYPCAAFRFLLLLEIILPAVSLAFCLVERRFLKMRVEEGPCVVLENRSPLPLADVKVAVRLRHPLSGQTETLRWQTALPGRSERRFGPEGGGLHCGKNEIIVSAPGLRDQMGLLRLPCGRAERITHFQFPEIYPVGVVIRGQVWSFWTEARSFSDSEEGEDSSQVYEIREYQPGDRLQSIHWKLSARQDQWMVKAWSLPEFPRILLLAGRGETAPAAGDYDRFFSVLLSFSLALAEQGCCHDIAWLAGPEGGFHTETVRNVETVYRLQGEIVGLWQTVASGTLSLTERYEAYHPERQYAVCYEWHTDGKLLMGDTVVRDWNREGWSRALSEEGQVF